MFPNKRKKCISVFLYPTQGPVTIKHYVLWFHNAKKQRTRLHQADHHEAAYTPSPEADDKVVKTE